MRALGDPVISLAESRSIALALAPEFAARVVEPESARPLLAGVEAAVSLIPGAGPIVSQVRALLDPLASAVAGLAVPSPWGTLVVLSHAAVVDGSTYLSTIAHEFCHAAGVQTLGAGQVAVDYLHPEMRAAREATPGGVGLWVRYLVTGVRPSPDDAGVVRSDLYHLGAEHRAFGRELVASCLATIDSGAVPPSRVARRVLEVLRSRYPDAVVAPEYKATDAGVSK